MPYITQSERKALDPHIKTLIDAMNEEMLYTVAGNFTYIVYRLLRTFFMGHFWTRALGIGCLICAILEIYRREHGPYENEAIKRNGDVL